MSSQTSQVNSQNICGLCDEKTSKYCCPRCSIFYCSLDCYKSEKHLNCSESFYKDCVNEELAAYQVDDESKRKMIEILKRMQNNDVGNPETIEEMLQNMNDTEEIGDESIDSDDDQEIDLQDRIKGINLDDPDALWNALTEDERNDFEALLNQGNVDFIPEWEPWWMHHKKEQLVEDVDDKDALKNNETWLKNCPSLVKVPKFTDLTKVKPSPVIRFNIANTLAAYAFTMRYFNGEVNPAEGTVYLLSVCGNLDSNTNYEDPAIAVESVAQKCLQSELIETNEQSLEIMKDDVLQILKGPSKHKKAFYCKAALSHLHQIFSEAKTYSSDLSKDKSNFSKKFPEHTEEHLPNIDVSKLKKCIKKIEYYLSFIESYGQELH